MSFQMLFYDFLLWDVKEAILKNAANQTVLVPIDLHCIFANGNQNWSPTFFKLFSFTFHKIKVWNNMRVSKL